ncbi:hypothetical protein [Lactococcus lactis]|uniref:hypothetical protein n=1 Tax=Lactococcus lactis TaxID=1358 RepID=UPI000C9F9F42|nr:hypothetical protein [Lactococcus lactis]AUS70061.1 hypothetical protein LLG50_08260 [Lactococcus lactis subsp. lactis]
MKSKIKSKSEIFREYLKNPQMVETIAVVHTIELDFDITKKENVEIHKYWNPDSGELVAENHSVIS